MLGLLRKKESRRLYGDRKIAKPKTKKNFDALRDASELKPQKWYGFLAKLMSLILKNYKLMLRSKTSSLIFFFGPLLIIFLVSIGFNTSSVNNINVAVFSESYSPLTETLLANISDAQFNFKKFDSQEKCIDAIKFESYHLCLIFPANMVLDNSANNNINVYVDNSRINLAYLIIDKLSAKVALRSTELSSGIVSQILGAVDNINKEATQGKSQIEAIETNNKNANSKLNSVLLEFSDFDFDYSALDLSASLDEIEDIRDRYNLSSSVFSDLKTNLNSLKVQYNAVAGKLDESKNNVDEIKSGISSLTSYLNADKSTISSIKSVNENILKNINTIKITNVDSIVSPLRTTIKPISLKKSYLIFTFPTLLVLLIMFVSLLMSATAIIREKKSMAYFRNFITPTFDGMFLIAQYLSDISIIFLQLVIILGVASIFLKGILWEVYIVAGGILLLLASIFIFLGLIIGYLFKSEESATTAAVSVAMLFLLFSNAILPLETLTGVLRQVVLYNPFVLGETILKRLVLFETTFSSIYQPLYILLAWFGVTFIFAILVKVITRKNT
jgi:ABC-2 type transport system permease protein